MKPVVTQTEEELTYVWTDFGVGIQLTQMHLTPTGQVKAHVVAHSLRPEMSGHIWWDIIALTGTTARKTLVSKLDKLVKRSEGEWEWDIDRCFYDAYERFISVPEAVDLADVEVPSLDTEFLYRPVVPHGQVTVFVADQGSTKSYFMEYLSACTVAGQPSVFGPPTEISAAIYFDWEVDERVARRRLDWICRGLGLERVPRGLHYLNMSDRGRLIDRVRDMRHEIQRLDASLVLIDSLTFATGGDLNSAEFAAPTMSAIGGLGDGVTKLVSAHPTKASRNSTADDISVIGSGLFEFRARAIWLMQREKDAQDAFNVSMKPRKPFDGMPHLTLAYRVRFDSQAHAVYFEKSRIEDSWDLSQRSLSLAERIRFALKRGSANTLQLAAQLDVRPETVRKECNRMADVMSLSGGGGAGNTTVWGLRA